MRCIRPGIRGVELRRDAARRDAWAKANRVVVEEAKPKADRGRYLHPEAHGKSRERGVGHAHYLEAKEHLTRK